MEPHLKKSFDAGEVQKQDKHVSSELMGTASYPFWAMFGVEQKTCVTFFLVAC